MARMLALLIALTFAVAATGDDCTAIALDASPAEIVWRASNVTDVRADRDAVFVETKNALRRVERSTGTTIWTYEFVDAFRRPDFVVLDERIAIVRENHYVTFLDKSSGEQVGRVDAGNWISHLAGPPLLAVTQDEHGAKLITMTSDGTILEAQTVPRVSDVLIVDDVAVVQFEAGHADPELDVAAGYDLATLAPLWSEKKFTFNKQVIDGRIYLGDIFWSDGAKAIDPKTGAIDALVPVRDPFKQGGSEEFDLQVVLSKWEGAWRPGFGTCDGLRRNDARSAKTMWRTDLPFNVSATLRDGERLYVAGSRDADHRYLVVLDWVTGKVQHGWSGVPKMSRLQKLDDLVLGFDLEAELVAVRMITSRASECCRPDP